VKDKTRARSDRGFTGFQEQCTEQGSDAERENQRSNYPTYFILLIFLLSAVSFSAISLAILSYTIDKGEFM